MKVSIIGQGYVGLTIASFAAEHFEVIGFDSDNLKVNSLNLGISHVEGVSSESISKAISSKQYKATANPADIDGSDIVIIAVPTPLDSNREPDLSFIESACLTIAQNMSNSALIINESTSFPGTLRDFIKPKIEENSPIPLEHIYAISPERVDPGRSDWNQKNTPRLYAGLTQKATEETRKFYSHFCDALIEVSSPEIAEAAKLFENTFRQVNIALVNEFAQIAHALGISVHETLDAAGTKPYGFMKFFPGAGVGGHCIPVDPTYLSSAANKLGIPATFIDRANEVNLHMPKYIVARIKKDNGDSLKGKTIQLVGVSYKSNISDVRETPAALILEELVSEGAIVTWHDPIVHQWMGSQSSDLGGSEISIVVTIHDVFDHASIKKSAKYVFDTTGKIKGVKTL